MFVMWYISSDIHPSGLVKRLESPKKVIFVASKEDWVERSPLGVYPLLHIIEVLTVIYL